MEIKGKVIAALDVKKGVSKSTGKEWSSQDYVIETQEQYPKKVCFNIWGDKIEAFAVKVGEMLTVSIDIDAHEYEGKWFNQIRAWKVERGDAPTAPAPMENNPIPPTVSGDVPF